MRIILLVAVLAWSGLFVMAVCWATDISIEQHDGRLWAVWSNTPPTWTISTSSNLTDWVPWLQKKSGAPLERIEADLSITNDARYWRLLPTP